MTFMLIDRAAELAIKHELEDAYFHGMNITVAIIEMLRKRVMAKEDATMNGYIAAYTCALDDVVELVNEFKLNYDKRESGDEQAG